MAYAEDFGIEICNVLGLDPDTIKKINITIEAGKEVVIELTRIVLDDEAKSIKEIMSKYQIELKEIRK